MAVTLHGFPQTIAVTIVRGNIGGTAYTVDGDIDTGDDILSVRHCSGDLQTNADVTGNASITGHNEVTVATTNATGNWLVITYAKAAAA
jgi:hypothetical protein